MLCALALSGAALAGERRVRPLEPASPNAEGINDSYFWIAIFTGAIFVLVQGRWSGSSSATAPAAARASDDGAQVHGNTNLELAWTVAPVLILVAIGSFVFYKLPGIQDVPRRAPAARSSGQRLPLLLELPYPNGVIAVDRLRAPVGQTTQLEVTAPDFDVIHSWWIPALGGKFDAIPGVTNETWFNAEATRDLPGPVRRVLRDPARR